MRVEKVSIRKRFVVELVFDDGTSGTVDLGRLAGRGVFAAWEEPGAFEEVGVGSGGELSWACGVDLCADALYLEATDGSVDTLFPAITTGSRCA